MIIEPEDSVGGPRRRVETATPVVKNERVSLEILGPVAMILAAAVMLGLIIDDWLDQ